MLTEDHLIQLQPLTQHPKFGKLLQAAIQTWSLPDVTPAWGEYGVDYASDVIALMDANECCLLGASVVGKEWYYGSIFLTIENSFQISLDSMEGLFQGFDGYVETSSDDNEAFEFGLKVREIIQPKKFSYAN